VLVKTGGVAKSDDVAGVERVSEEDDIMAVLVEGCEVDVISISTVYADVGGDDCLLC